METFWIIYLFGSAIAIFMTIMHQKIVFGGYDNGELPLSLMYLILALIGSYTVIIALIIIYFMNKDEIDYRCSEYFKVKKC